MSEFGEIRRINLRDIWANEANDFTPWLAENIQALGEALGLELELQGKEQNVGNFSLDLLAKDLGSGHDVIIENQYSSTNHDHLGKLITYAAGYDASIVIWISEEIRDEHRQALEWLNQRTDSKTEFFGVVVEVIKIDDSLPAYNFKTIVFPNEWQKNKRRSSCTATSPRAEAYRSYFQKLIDELRIKHKFTGAKVAQPQNWYTFSSGFTGIPYGASFAKGDRVRVEIYIDQGESVKNKQLFDFLKDNRDSIENKIGEKLDWERLDEKRASRVAIYKDGSILGNTTELEDIRLWSIKQLLMFKKVFVPWLKKIM